MPVRHAVGELRGKGGGGKHRPVGPFLSRGLYGMGVEFTLGESSALYGLLAENTTDIILKTDRQGFVVHASPAIERLGFPVPGMLIGPHLLDLVQPAHHAAIEAQHRAAIAGDDSDDWIEFAAVTGYGRERWFEIRTRGLRDERQQVYGALSVMRCIEERRTYEERLFAAAMTDPLTGLTNRKAFVAMLQHLVDRRSPGCVALFDIDHFKAINMRYGHAVGDEVLIVFADLLRTMMRSEDILSRIGSESLAVLLPGATPAQAEAICGRIVATLAEIQHAAPAGTLSITASAGLARIGESLDATIRRAELALFVAKASGRSRLELADEPLPDSLACRPRAEPFGGTGIRKA